MRNANHVVAGSLAVVRLSQSSCHDPLEVLVD